MASSGVLAAGTTSYSSTLVANTADAVTFPDRYGYVSVANTGTTVLYVRTDGQAATVAGAGCYAVMPGEAQVFANALPLWFQSSMVIPNGADNALQQSKDGQEANPGTHISIISASANPYTMAAAG